VARIQPEASTNIKDQKSVWLEGGGKREVDNLKGPQKKARRHDDPTQACHTIQKPGPFEKGLQ